MQPLTRLFSRPVLNLSKDQTLLRNSNLAYYWPLLRVSTCPHCRVRTQLRRFVVDRKQNRISGSTPDESQAKPGPNYSTDYLDHNSDLPSDEAGRRLAVTKRFSHLMDRLQGNIFTASQRINDITGYSGIEALKNQITVLESKLQDAQNAVVTARLTYKATVTDRASTQREVTTLLARKDSWSPSDLERFTTLYRMDHSNEQAVQEAATRLADAERDVEHASSKLRNSILSRYHEEQIWSDKIRRMSTWGTWGLMGVNVLLFLVFQFGFEPWRRKRLIQGFEGKVLEALEMEKKSKSLNSEHNNSVPSKTVVIDAQRINSEGENEATSIDLLTTSEAAEISNEYTEGSLLADSIETPILATITNFTGSKKLALYASNLTDLFTDKTVQIRKHDIMIIALESAFIGATIATTVFISMFHNS